MRDAFRNGWKWSVVVMALVAVFGSHCRDPNTPIDCGGGEKHAKIDCDLEFSADSFKLSGGGSFLSANAHFETEKVALRAVNDNLMAFSFQASRLCKDYNACAVTRAEYVKRSEDIRGVVQSAHDAEKSGDRGALGRAYHGVVPDDKRVELEMAFDVNVSRPEDMAKVPDKPCDKEVRGSYARTPETPIAQGEAVPSGSRFFFTVRLSRPAYVYLFQRKPSGKLIVMFPSDELTLKNPISPGTPVRIPNGTFSYCSDQNDIGVESVFVVASLEPIKSLEGMIPKVDSGDDKGVTQQFAFASLAPTTSAPAGDCKSRALPMVDDAASTAAPPACVRTRGLPMVDDAPTAAAAAPRASIAARTEAADTAIAKLFKFDHMTPQAYAELLKSGGTKSRGIVIEN